MKVPCPRHPPEFYTEKIVTGEPFYYLSYGDGELLVAAGKRTGRSMQCGEVVDARLEKAIRDSLLVDGEDIYRGTDPNLLNWRDYKGNDYAMFSGIGQEVESFLQGHCAWVKFVDGVMWEEAGQNGALTPLLRALRGRIVVLIGNPKFLTNTHTGNYLCQPVATLLKVYGFVPIPKGNAWANFDNVCKLTSSFPGSEIVYVACMGLGAIPLAMELRKKNPNSTFLDLGSSLDVMAGLGSTRGWRRELYQKPEEWAKTVVANLGEYARGT